MRKLLAILMALVTLAGFTACGDNSKNEDVGNAEETTVDSNVLTEEEIADVNAKLAAASCLPSEYRYLVDHGVYRDISYGSMINYTFREPIITYERYKSEEFPDGNGSIIVSISGNYRYATNDSTFAYNGTVELYVHESGNVSPRSDPNNIHSIMRAMAMQLAAY